MNYSTNFNQTWQAHLTVTARSVTTTGCKRSKFKVTRERGRSYIWTPVIISTPLGQIAF